MRLEDIHYELPEEAIAQVPLADRSASRLLVAGRGEGVAEHLHMRDFSQLVRPGDVIVVNDSRVRPARVKLFKNTGGAVEVFLLHPGPDDVWEALVRPSRRVAPGTALIADSGDPVFVVGQDLGEGRRRIASACDESVADLAERHGVMPLPPYIDSVLDDPDRYQTVYANRTGSAAAPTAGLHFTPDLLAECEAAGAEVHRVELQVGLGTFRPIVAETVAEHEMHAESFVVPDETWNACRQARSEGHRVIAIGTTSTRALERAARGDTSGQTDLFITPGYDWQVVDALLTNFHLPHSSLLVMLAAFIGPDWRDLYADALAAGYRFLSFGDAMFVERAG